MKRLFYHFLGGCESDALFLTLRSRGCKISIVCKYIFKIPVESKIERRIIKKKILKFFFKETRTGIRAPVISSLSIESCNMMG